MLRSNVQWLKDHPQARFYIEGYTDCRGDVVYNLALAQRRAETVRANLLNRGISADRIILTVSCGNCTRHVLSKLKGVGKEVAALVSFTLRFIDLSLTARLNDSPIAARHTLLSLSRTRSGWSFPE